MVEAPDTRNRWRDEVKKWTDQQRAQPCHRGSQNHEFTQAARCPEEYVPLPMRVTLVEEYTILAAVHDFAAEREMELLQPFDESTADSMIKGVPFCLLTQAVAGLSEGDGVRLAGFLEDVKTDLRRERSAKRAGRRVERREAERRAEIHQAWTKYQEWCRHVGRGRATIEGFCEWDGAGHLELPTREGLTDTEDGGELKYDVEAVKKIIANYRKTPNPKPK